MKRRAIIFSLLFSILIANNQIEKEFLKLKIKYLGLTIGYIELTSIVDKKKNLRTNFSWTYTTYIISTVYDLDMKTSSASRWSDGKAHFYEEKMLFRDKLSHHKIQFLDNGEKIFYYFDLVKKPNQFKMIKPTLKLTEPTTAIYQLREGVMKNKVFYTLSQYENFYYQTFVTNDREVNYNYEGKTYRCVVTSPLLVRKGKYPEKQRALVYLTKNEYAVPLYIKYSIGKYGYVYSYVVEYYYKKSNKIVYKVP